MESIITQRGVNDILHQVLRNRRAASIDSDQDDKNLTRAFMGLMKIANNIE